jgi:hypothetical protein
MAAAMVAVMAAVLALVMVPTLASLGLFFCVTGGDDALRSGFALATFALLGAGMLFGLMKFVRGMEH